MFQPNFAGVTFHCDYFEKVAECKDMVNAKWGQPDPDKGPLRFFMNHAQGPNVSVFCKSVDSMPLSDLIRQLVEQGVPHRLVSASWLPARTHESFSRNGEELSIHMLPCDMIYMKNFTVEDAVAIRVDGMSSYIRKIIVVGPHVEARKVYRWTAWWLRDNKELGVKWVEGMVSRQQMGKVYIQLGNQSWVILHKGECLNGVATGNVRHETFEASLNMLKTVEI